MQASTLNELKKELAHLSQKELVEIITRLARYKKENKELITYLLSDVHDERGYINSVKGYIDEEISAIPADYNLYYAKKTLRKILRTVNKYCRYSGIKTTEVELLLHYLYRLRHSGIQIQKSQILTNVYESQLKKVAKILPTLHEDLQHDYGHRLLELELPHGTQGLLGALIKKLR
ncbi:MAG: hypothetical protein JSS76_09170 [Bacteroidetes bacterium]|nr:hypothetical protein [Bacteroidota bacterium]MBS1684913.1 hypothetical protein [Bacteroidota bacterium]